MHARGLRTSDVSSELWTYMDLGFRVLGFRVVPFLGIRV